RRASYPPQLPRPCPPRVKAQMPGESTKTRPRPLKDADRGFRIRDRVKDCAAPLVSAAEFVLPCGHRAGQGQRRCGKDTARDRACYDVGGDATEAGQAEVRIAQRTAAGRARKHHVAIE